VLTFDPQDPAHQRSGVPFDVLGRIREEQPVCPTPAGDWYLSRQEEILDALKDVGTFRTDLARSSGLGGIEEVPDDQLFLSEIAEPRHGQVRRLYNAYFGPHRLSRVAPFVREVCFSLLDGLVARGKGDMHAEYALPIPSMVMAHVMGLPDEAADRFMEWSLDGTVMLRPATPGMYEGGPAIQAYFAGVLAARRRMPEPPDDVFRALMRAEVGGAPLSDTEIVTQLQFMIQAGVHTTRGLLTHLMHRLLVDAALYRQVREDPDLIPRMVEESLRHDAPVLSTTRRCTRDVSLGGVEMREGDWVHVGLGSANRDATVYEEPEEFRLDRRDPRNHLAFGAGPHVCPGASLARLEAVTAVEVLVDRVADLSTLPGVDYPPLPGGLGHRPIPAKLHAAGERTRRHIGH
jgi:cytochrome P450